MVVPRNLNRVVTGQSVVVQIGVKNKAGVVAGTLCTVNIVATYGPAYGDTQTAITSTGKCGFGDYKASASLNNH